MTFRDGNYSIRPRVSSGEIVQASVKRFNWELAITLIAAVVLDVAVIYAVAHYLERLKAIL